MYWTDYNGIEHYANEKIEFKGQLPDCKYLLPCGMCTLFPEMKTCRLMLEDKERPQGEWIKIFENPFTNGYKCPFCGHEIHVTEQFLPKVTECEECGADMKGGAE